MQGRIKQLEDQVSCLKQELEDLAVYQQDKDDIENEYFLSQQRFKTIFEKSIIGYKIINDDLQIIKVNDALLKMLGYTQNEMLTKRITDFAQAEFVAHWKELQHELWTTDLPSFTFDTCLIKKDKLTIWVRVHSIKIDDNGEKLGFTVLQDLENNLR